MNSSNAPSSESGTRLRGWRLAVARALAFGVSGLTVLLSLVSLPNLVRELDVPPCDAVLSGCLLSPQQVSPLSRLGLTPHGLAVVVAVLCVVAFVLAAGVAALLIWRRSDDWMALLVATALVLLPAGFTPLFAGLTGGWQALGAIFSNYPFVPLVVLMGLFPSGRFVPRWVWVPILALPVLTTELVGGLPNAVVLPLLLAGLVALIVAQVYRYRRVSTPVQRMQTKWAVSGLVLALVVNQAFWQPDAWIPALQRPDSLYPLIFYFDSFLIVCVVAGAFSVAILRFRLYDIDVIIRRTLIYGSLSAILAAVYFSVVFGAQTLAHSLMGQRGDQPIIIVASTLLIAVLFNPLRRRIQRAIDRAFYRGKYDAARTVAAFAARLRTQTDLGALGADLIAVVHETVRPEHVSLWLRVSSQDSTGRPLRTESV